MAAIDWSIMGLYFLISILIALAYARRAGKSTDEFFLGGRNLPWWLAGLSMVATTFAADTPLAVTELIASHGIAGNWLWWNMVIGGMLTVFFFAKLWRRSGVLTDLEFIELRYSGKPAAFLRGFRSIYLGLFMNAVIMGWVNVAMGTILSGMFGIPPAEVFWYIAAAMAFTAVYASISGLWGVAVTDVFQFAIAMTGCIILAILVVNSPEIGGLDGLTAALPAETFSLYPVIGDVSGGAAGVFALSAGAFFAYIGVQWWASWYPGAEPGGGGYVAQRMLATKNERHSVYAVLFFQVAHYCLRPWPWILVGLSSLVLYPELSGADTKLGYIYAMNDFLPAGLKGVLVAAFFAAYMSTIATHLNWGTSYIVNDFWKRFMRKQSDEKHYVFVSRLTTILLMIVSLLLTLVIDSISGAWQFLIESGAGLGLVLILRWYWWRVNAWSEIVASIAPVCAYAGILLINHFGPEEASISFPESMFIIVVFTTISWLLVTLLTRPTEAGHLENFVRIVRPGGRLWKPVSEGIGLYQRSSGFSWLFAAWIVGVLFIYAVMFALGEFFFGTAALALTWSGVAGLSGIFMYFVLQRIEKDTDRAEVFK